MPDTILLPHYPQSAEGLCLAACARMVLAHWSTTRSEEELAELLGIRNWGTSASAIQRLSRWGWNVDYGCGTLKDLEQWLRDGIPVIAFVRTGFLEHWAADVGHAIVIVGITDDQVYIHDPAIAKAPLAIPVTSFEAAWTEMDYGYALVTPVAGKRPRD